MVDLFNIYRFCNRTSILFLALLVSFPLFSNIIEVGGELTESTMWTSQDTVIVFQDLTVPNDVMLVIEAGALIKININRGIFVERGRLLVLGSPTDSVHFVANHSVPGLNWKWKGILIKNANIEDPSHIDYAHIADAETGIRLEECFSVLVENSTIDNCQNLGYQLVNSSSCLLVNCNIENNYDGVEILVSYLGNSSDNVINSCIIRNQNNNIYINREEGGIYKNNLISENLIDSGNNGFWIDNNGGSVNSQNIIEKNRFTNNGSDVGYGLFMTYDSTIVRNNIFWKNNIAIFSGANGDNCQIINNSFYQNKWAIAIGPGSHTNKYLNNTFSQNETKLLGIKETRDVDFSRNNLLHNDDMQNIVINSTSINMSIIDNYWGTSDTVIIDRLIFDKGDNPDLGKLYYKPFLTTIDTSNPVAPPYYVIKQFVNNRVKLTWFPNEESDLAGYNIYNGIYVNYSFSQKHEIGLDTSFIFPNDLSIYDTIGVSAFDSATNNLNAQSLGHESPFSFAKLYPYAGADTIICKHIEMLDIVSTSIPMEFTKLYWQTNGDGSFTDSTIKFPHYFPGTVDVQSGNVLLTLNVIADGDTLLDSFRLSIIDDPIAYAGNDTVVIADTDILLAEAKAENYNNVIWFTSGDGVFNFDSLVNPIYYPGSLDTELGLVYLEMIAYSQCGFFSDTTIISIEPYYSVEGRLWADQKLLNLGAVVAYRDDVDEAKSVQIESVTDDGLFRFEKLMKGNYFLYALPDTSNLDDYVPGYYANKLRWQSAYLLPVDANVYDVDIYLPKIDYVLPIGEGSISGHMVLPLNSSFNSNVYCMPWFSDNGNDYCNGGLSNITVFLFNKTKSNLLDFTLTDEFGDFYFSQLPYGSYTVDAEKAGFLTTPSSVITLSQENKDEANVIIELDNQKHAISFNRNIVTGDNILVYPNPVSAELNLTSVNLNSVQTIIEIYNVFGNRVLFFKHQPEYGTTNIQIEVKTLLPGLYFGRIVYPNGATGFHFLKM